MKLEKIKKINETIGPYWTFLVMVVFFVTTSFGVYSFLFRPQDLSVYVKRQEVNFPLSINNEYIKVWNYLIDNSKDSTVDSAALKTLRFLQNTNNFWIVTLHNATKKSIKHIIVKITDVSSVSCWALNGSFLLENERSELMKHVLFESASGLFVLNNIESLPPNMDISLYIWGKLPTLNLDQNLIVSYEDGDAHVGHEVTEVGFKAFLCEYLYEFLTLIFIVFFFVYRHLLKKFKDASR